MEDALGMYICNGFYPIIFQINTMVIFMNSNGFPSVKNLFKSRLDVSITNVIILHYPLSFILVN